MKVDRQFLETRADAAKLFETCDALLGQAAAAIRPAVEPCRRIMPGMFVVLVRNDRLDVLLRQPVVHALHTIPLVRRQLSRLVATAAPLSPLSDQARDRLADDRLGARRFVDLTGRDFDGKGDALTVSDHMELRSKPASAG